MATVNFRTWNLNGYKTIFTKFYISVLVLFVTSYIFHTWLRKTIVIRALVCSFNDKNNDCTCLHHKECAAMGCKVQYSTNNKFYFLFADRVQPGPHHLSDMEWKVGRHTKGFFYLLFYDKPWHWKWFLKTTLCLFSSTNMGSCDNDTPSMIITAGNGQTLGTSKVHSVLKLPSWNIAPSS